MGLRRYRKFVVVVLIIAIFVIVANIGIYEYFGFSMSVNSKATSQAEVSLNVDPYAPVPAPVVVRPTGGGGGGFPAKAIYDFNLDQTVLKVSAKVGDRVERVVKISNPNEVALEFNVSHNMGRLIEISDGFELKGHAERNFGVDFVAPEDVMPRTYTGNVIFTTQYSSKKLPVIFDIQSRKVFFEVNLDMPAEYKSLDEGESLFFQVSIFSVAEVEEGTVALEYFVRDLADNVVVNLTEIVYVRQQLSFSKAILLPDDLPAGDYVVSVVATYDDTTATTSDMFSIREAVPFMTWLWILFAVFALFLALIFYELRVMRLKRFVKESPVKLAKMRKRIVSGRVRGPRAESALNKLKMQKELLERAFKKGYVKEDAYMESRRKMAEMAGKLRKKYL